jgi:hypothetical protein
MDDTASTSLIIRRFGSWSEGKQEAGIDEDLRSAGANREYTDEDVLQDMRECADRHDGRCTVDLMANHDDLVSASVAVERFGSWSDAKEKAGLMDERVNNFRPRTYTDEDYLELIRDCEEKYGKASQRLFDEDDEFPSASAVRKRFDSWADAKAEAGVDEHTGKYTEEQLLGFLRRCEENHGKVTISLFSSNDDFPAPETIQRRFGSWNEGKEAAGVGKYSDGS